MMPILRPSMVQLIRFLLVLAIAGVLGVAPHAAGQDQAAEAASQGLIPVPDYTGDLFQRSHLTGDWGGARSELANVGVQLDVAWTQAMQSVVDGGADRGTRYGGKLNYGLTLDLMRMGLLPGAMVKFRGETRYGESVNSMSGPILPPNTDAFFPLASSLDENLGFVLTNLTYYQFLSDHFGVFLGKIDTLDGDPNEFASGRGTTQFMNANFVFPTSPLLTTPYATLGGGIIIKPIENLSISSLVINSSDSSTTTGFTDFGEGSAWMTEGQLQYRLGDLPGGQNLGFVYGFDNEFRVLNQRLSFQPGQGVVAPTTDETWAVYWSAWQYVYVEEANEGLIDITNGKQDLQGIGLFTRLGFADEDTNPLEVAFSVGAGAKGLIPSRDHDTLGLAYFFNSIETGRFADRASIQDQTQGFEAYYNLAITPAADLTFDLQAIESIQKQLDPAVILGLRLRLMF